MPQVTSAIESHPELYADISAAGGLAAALTRTAAALGLDIGSVDSTGDGSPEDARIRSALPGRADLTITALRYRRLFSVDNHEPGVAHARGRTPDLAEVVKAAAAWYSGADPRRMKAAASFIDLPLMAEARATGSAERVVETNWLVRREAWHRLAQFKSGSWHEPVALAALRALFDAAYAEPRLRRLYVVTSHFNLWFSQCTDFPFARVGAVIAPQSDGRYRVRRWQHRDDEGEFFDAPEAAAARATELLPPDCGGAILGTAADPPARRLSNSESEAPG